MNVTNFTDDYDNMTSSSYTDILKNYDNLSSTNYTNTLSNCTNNENTFDINLPTLLLTKPCGLSFLCLMSLMVYRIIKHLFR